MATELEDRVAKLEGRLKALSTLVAKANRAFVIEFAGTPKSGKSTSIEAIRHFFTRQGFRVHVLVERASSCPIPMKGHLFFNTWCAATMLAELLANVETRTDVIIVDRGILDALVWLASQVRRGEVSDEEAEAIQNFLLLERWRSLIDLGVVMTVSAEEAIKRENGARITAKPGTIMNKGALSAVTDSVAATVQKFQSRFPCILCHDTAGKELKLSLVELAESIVDRFADFLNPEVLVIPRDQAEALHSPSNGAFDANAAHRIQSLVHQHGKFIRRDAAEQDSKHVQVVSCGLLEFDGKIFVFERKDADPKSQLYGKATILQGSHVWKRKEDGVPSELEAALLEKLSRFLFLSRKLPAKAIGYCWDGRNEASGRHVGVVYRVQIANEVTASELRRKEFRHERTHSITGDFQELNGLAKPDIKETLETWSQAVLCGLEIKS